MAVANAVAVLPDVAAVADAAVAAVADVAAIADAAAVPEGVAVAEAAAVPDAAADLAAAPVALPRVAYISITLTSISLSDSAAVTSSSHLSIACGPNAAVSSAWCLLSFVEISWASRDFEHSVPAMPSIFL